MAPPLPGGVTKSFLIIITIDELKFYLMKESLKSIGYLQNNRPLNFGHMPIITYGLVINMDIE